MPEQLNEKEYRIQYLGRLALALKTLESEGFVKTMTDLKSMAELEVMGEGQFVFLDNYDKDIISRDMGRNNGVPATWLKAKEKRDAERAAKAERQQKMALMEQVPDLAKAAKNLSTKPEEGSITEGIMNAA